MNDGKICTGPAHPVPVNLPLTEDNWYFHKTGPRKGRAVSRCKLCVNYNRLQAIDGQNGTVDCTKVFKFTEELVLRYGNASQAEGPSGVSANTLRIILKQEQCTIQKRTALKIITALDEKRRADRRSGTVNKKWRDAIRARALSEQRIEQTLGY